ncbi:LacI family DNA-binding transcriptional regulator [Parahaliea maris]|uniref:LacI family DNA-binding transcriptional regulator n=1 Tax=Parahaliea maris TaxID=2716870 RepID=A0A5C8ZR33_9GAMM|nr:LacI family DNA-binding transcriptional regulator [Parahaliea maris]TXS90264.1 LacI family DNA-binding transcriptional regulator [Parahaliea maris]
MASTTLPTLSDVAKAASVSSATVSRYFSNPDSVATKTAERIRQAVLETGYTPNRLAGSLASNKSQLVSILIPQLAPSLFIETIEALVSKLSSAGCIVTVGVTEFDAAHNEALIMAALAYRAKAIIVTGEVSDEVRKFIRQSSTTAIEIWDLPEDPIDIAVGFSHWEIGRSLAQFVRSRGYTRPHFVTNPGPRGIKRRNGFLEEWQTGTGCDVTESLMQLPFQPGAARRIFAEIQRLEERPDVVLCGPDWMAQGLIVEAMHFGLRVPEDIAVIGFGNSAVASEMRPTITSVDIDDQRIAETIAEILLNRDRGEEIREKVVNTGFKIIARESA